MSTSLSGDNRRLIFPMEGFKSIYSDCRREAEYSRTTGIDTLTNASEIKVHTLSSMNFSQDSVAGSAYSRC